MSVKSLLVKSIFSSWPSVHSGSARPAQPHKNTISANVNNSISMSIKRTIALALLLTRLKVLEKIEEVGQVLKKIRIEAKEEEVEEMEVEQEVGEKQEEDEADLGVGHRTGLDLSCSTQSSPAPSAHRF